MFVEHPSGCQDWAGSWRGDGDRSSEVSAFLEATSSGGGRAEPDRPGGTRNTSQTPRGGERPRGQTRSAMGGRGGGRAEGLRVEATEQRPGRGERVGRANGCWSLFRCSYCTFQLQNLYLYIL